VLLWTTGLTLTACSRYDVQGSRVATEGFALSLQLPICPSQFLAGAPELSQASVMLVRTGAQTCCNIDSMPVDLRRAAWYMRAQVAISPWSCMCTCAACVGRGVSCIEMKSTGHLADSCTCICLLQQAWHKRLETAPRRQTWPPLANNYTRSAYHCYVDSHVEAGRRLSFWLSLLRGPSRDGCRPACAGARHHQDFVVKMLPDTPWNHRVEPVVVLKDSSPTNLRRSSRLVDVAAVTFVANRLAVAATSTILAGHMPLSPC